MKKKNNKLLKAMPLVLVGIILLGTGAFGFWYYQEKVVKQSEFSPSLTVAPGSDLSTQPASDEPASRSESGVPDNWKTYKNGQYKFELKHPPSWKVDEYYMDPQKVTSGVLLETVFNTGSQLGPGGKSTMVEVWQPSIADSRIMSNSFPGQSAKEKNKADIGNQTGFELVFSGPSQIIGGVHDFRLYIVHTSNFTYAIHSDFCLDDKEPECDQFLSTFKFVEGE